MRKSLMGVDIIKVCSPAEYTRGGITKDAADCYQFLIIDFKDIATTHRFAKNLLRIKSLAKINIKNLNLIHARKTILSNSAGTVIMGKFDVIRPL